MKKFSALFFILSLLFITCYGQIQITNLLTENRHNPMGIDTRTPRFSWQLKSEKRNTSQSAYEIKLMQGKKTIWSSGKRQSDQSVLMPYGGPALSSASRYQWQVRAWDNRGKASSWSAPANFQTGMFDVSEWKARWIESGSPEDSINRPAQYFRKQFDISKKVQSATLFITAHGMYEAEMNGKRIGDEYLSPGWTSYNNRLQYQVFDVTNQVQRGANVIGATVGNGWYRGYLAWENTKNVYGKYLGLLCQLQITYADGSTELIVTEKSWKSSTGPITYAEIYHGETYDARREMQGWSTPKFQDADWHAVKEAEYPMTNLIATYNEPIRKKETFKPVKVIRTPAGERVLDFGQNLVGWVIVKAKGKAGDSITIKHGEVLDKAGNFYLDNLRIAKATAKYYLKGEGEEIFEPHFTFYGFRYIRIDDFPGEPDSSQFEAVALYSDMNRTGHFESSNPLINQLQHNIQWGQRGNFLDVPTDCPQRDERLGWTGDAQVFARTATFNFGVHNFFAKWLKDVAADQLNGSVPFVVPNVLGPGSGASTGWADAATIVPWTMYLAYGDKRILEDQYESMKAWVGYMERNSENYLWNKGFHFGDWLFFRPFDDNDGSSAVTDKYLIAQCYFAYSTELLIRTAKILGKQDDVARYNELLKDLKEAFVKEYMTPSGRLVSGTQTAYTLALHFDMLPESLRPGAVEKLVANINRYGHLTTGFLGTSYLCHVLTKWGHADLAYKLLFREEYPSWLYPVKMGATTIWERWDGIKTDGSFQTPGMNSFNHYAYGAIGDWMYRVVAGLDTDESAPGYKRIIIKPYLTDKLTHAAASLDTYYGKLRSGWRKENGKLILEVEIPVNTNAEIFIPATDASQIIEGGQLLSASKEISIKGNEMGYTRVSVGSGVYHFEVNAQDSIKK